MRTADPPENAFANKLAAWSDRFLHHPITPHLDARLIDALTGRELAAVQAAGASAVFSPDGRMLAQDTQIAYGPQQQSGFSFELWDVPPRRPIALLIGGAVAWTLLFFAAVGVIRKLRDYRLRQRSDHRPAVEPATGG
jgi:hypothetical protein